MIRLSEALAKVHLDDTINAVYVKEASRLLKQSIIHVEMPSIELESFEYSLEEHKRKLEKQEKEKNEKNGKEIIDVISITYINFYLFFNNYLLGYD